MPFSHLSHKCKSFWPLVLSNALHRYFQFLTKILKWNNMHIPKLKFLIFFFSTALFHQQKKHPSSLPINGTPPVTLWELLFTVLTGDLSRPQIQVPPGHSIGPTQTRYFPFSSYLVMWSPLPPPFNLPWEALLFLTSVPFPSVPVNSEIKTKFSRNVKLICQRRPLPPVTGLPAFPMCTLNSIPTFLVELSLQSSPHSPVFPPIKSL